MKLTDSKIQWIKNKVNHYCKLLEVEPPTFLILTRKHYEEWKEWRRKNKSSSFI